MMDGGMPSLFRISFACTAMACMLWPDVARGTATKTPPARQEAPQDTGFLNRKIELHGVSYRFQVYLPEDWRRDDGKKWPIILSLHGRGERGSEGMWQTQFGLAEEVRDHPERWPFVIVMPQCPLNAHWTDPAMLELAMAALDQESAEFHGDPARTYLTGLSMGGYGAWELAKAHPHRWAAIAIAASGVFWSYEPDRWQQANVLPAEYARAMGHTPVWLFHGSLDTTVLPRQSVLMFDALKETGGDVRFWLYEGLLHDCWTRAYDEPDLPRWLLDHRTPVAPETFAEFLMIPLHPPAIKLTTAQLDSVTGQYREPNGHGVGIIFRQGDQLFEKTSGGEVIGLEAESADSFFRPGDATGAHTVHLTFERDALGHVTSYVLDDSRHEEHWAKAPSANK
jgi:acetyl esterase/lipase